jgi:hypothetical protein
MNLKLASLFLLAAVPAGDDPRRIDFGTLSSFEYEEGKPLPKEVRDLDKKEIRISGFMRGENGATQDLEVFMIVNEACGCSGDPKLNEVLYCAMPEGQKVNAIAGSVLITGTILVGEEKEDGYVVSLYRVEVTKVEKA